MDAATATPLPAARPAWLDWLRQELAPYPGRGAETLRIVITVALVVIISMALRIPETLLSAYMVFFVSKENKVMTALIGIMLTLGVTIAIGVSLIDYRFTFDFPALRVPNIALILFLGFYALRVLSIGPLGFAIGFVLAATQSIAELMPTAEYLVHTLLWLWVAITYPIVLTVIVHQLRFPAPFAGWLADRPAAPAHPKPKKRLLAEDAFTNPAHVHFALKVTLAAMTCYILYTGLDWPGIHTAFITCCFISLESLGATLHKGALRLSGCCVGGLLGFLSIMYLIPHMESITSLVLLVAAVTALAGWVATGSERIAYGGLQIALAFYMCVLQSFEPDTDFTKIRDRLMGIILGIVATTLVYRYVWPEPERQ